MEKLKIGVKFQREVTMEASTMKNMVILKNLPSNLVEEAIVVLKSNKTAKKLEKIEKNKKIEKNQTVKQDKDYILKEAEMLVANYISKIENDNQQKTIKTIKTSKKYLRLKKYAYISTIIMIIQTLVLIIR